MSDEKKRTQIFARIAMRLRRAGRASAGLRIFCVVRSASGIEVPKDDVRNKVLSAVRHTTRRVKNTRRLYVRAASVSYSTQSAVPAGCAFTRTSATTFAQTLA